MRLILLLILSVVLTACRSTLEVPPVAAETASPSADELPFVSLAEFRERAAQFKSVIAVPELENTPATVLGGASNAIRRANAALDRIAACPPNEVSLRTTIVALDDAMYEASLTGNRIGLMKETSTNAVLRDAATEAMKIYSEWAVGLDYREDVYKVMKSFADTKPRLRGEEAKLLEETLRDYKRAGLGLPKAERDEVERLRKELSNLTTDYEANITKAQLPVKFTRADLEGVPEDFLNQKGVKTGDDEFTVMANITFHYITVMENAKREATRRRFLVLHDTLARAENVPLLKRIIELRDTIASKLGYASWADLIIEPKMAKNAATARKFCEDLKTGLQPKFDAELEAFRQLKAKETGDAGTKINVWDWRYYSNQLKKERYTVDAEALRVYFPYDRALGGMFRIYQRIFGLKFARVAPPMKWCDDLQLFAVSDAKSGEPLGLFYLDMFPRQGKYHHFAQFGIIEGKLLPDGRYQRPTAALVCNFPPPSKDKPSLLSHDDVVTLFHEFGHALHTLTTQAKFARFSGTSVPRDFVEAPSQMLENWVWDKRVLDSFAADYRDPSKKIPAEILAKLKEARLATIGTFYRRQLSFALLDLALHTDVKAGGGQNVVDVANRVLTDVFLPVPPDTAMVAYFGHLMGYDAGYYGYAWAAAIAEDMATVFERAPDGYYDVNAGARLRQEIYAVGSARDVNVSIEKFLGRPRSIQPFLRELGIGKNQR